MTFDFKYNSAKSSIEYKNVYRVVWTVVYAKNYILVSVTTVNMNSPQVDLHKIKNCIRVTLNSSQISMVDYNSDTNIYQPSFPMFKMDNEV